MSTITRSRSPGVTWEDIVSRRSTEYSTRTRGAFAFSPQCEDGCELGTSIAFLADYSCESPPGRHDAALVLNLDVGDAFRARLDGTTCALNFPADTARCLAGHLLEQADAVELFDVGRAPASDQGPELVCDLMCPSCDSWIPGVWVGEYLDPRRNSRVVVGYALRDTRPFTITASPSEARCLASRLGSIAKVVDDANALDQTARELNAIFFREKDRL